MVLEITRDTAEAMIEDHDVLKSYKTLDKCIIIISFNLSNEQTLIVKYNMQKKHKAYFLEEHILSNSRNWHLRLAKILSRKGLLTKIL